MNVRQQAEAQARVKAAEASRRRAETQIEQAEAAAEHADADYRRFKELVKKGSITVDQFEQAGVDQRADGRTCGRPNSPCRSLISNGNRPEPR